MKVLIIDNYDSFVYNLAQYIGEYADVDVLRNDQVFDPSSYSSIVVSPGPGHPQSIPQVMEIIRRYGKKIPILGVCLGHQAIALAFGGSIKRAKRIVHGKTSLIFHDEKGVYKGVSNPLRATRYHSLIVSEVPDGFSLTARSEKGKTMGIRHEKYPVEGVQFHPESILTSEGKQMIKNFLEVKK
ncbi:MAG: aminodeoxychorismate/anthranilate synthase component II [Euryarchaeota archaeon]|nr:aminodeoxychorismate/anthranilate synthase component II [Euryarchaeota archaeon]